MYDSIPPAPEWVRLVTLGQTFDFTFTDAGGVSFHPWTDGAAIGFECHHPDGRIEYLYFNPSNDDDEVPMVSNAFVYQGTEGDVCVDMPYVHFNLFQD